MTDSKNGMPQGSRISSKRTLLIASAVALAVILIAVGIAAVVAANRNSSGQTASQTGGDGAPIGGSASAAATGAADATTTATTTDTGVGGGSADSTNTQRPAASRPGRDVLNRLKPGQWQLYGARVVAQGVEMKASDSTDVQGITVECEALTKSGSGYSHATARIAFSATGPVSGKGGPWKLYGTWVLSPDDGTKASQHYGQGVAGALAGRSDVRPPVRSGRAVAGFSPIGAYRPRAAGVIESGTFVGNAMFEGVLRLPSVFVPPPTK